MRAFAAFAVLAVTSGCGGADRIEYDRLRDEIGDVQRKAQDAARLCEALDTATRAPADPSEAMAVLDAKVKCMADGRALAEREQALRKQAERIGERLLFEDPLP